MASLIQFRGNTAAYWTTNNPTLAPREMVIETDTMRYKFGNGTDAWNDLPYNQFTGETASLTLAKPVTDPTAADPNTLIMFARFIAGRAYPAYVGPSGQDTALQPFLARNKVGYWCPQGNSTVVPGVFGYTAPTSVGTIARNVTTGTMFTRMRRLGYQSAATAGSLCSSRVAVAQITPGDSGLGGFTKIIRFGVSDPVVPVAAARMFVGISATTSAGTNVEPDTWLNSIGVGCRAADTNLQLFASGTTKQTPIDLGANFPGTTSNTDVYELALFSPATTDSVFWQVTRLNTGHMAAGVVLSGGGVTGPASSVLLTYLQAWRTNNTTASTVAFDIMSDYIETDL